MSVAAIGAVAIGAAEEAAVVVRGSRALWHSGGRLLEHGAVVIGRQLDQPGKLQAARFDRVDGLLRRQSQFGLRSARLAQDHRFLARALMPVDDRKMTGRAERRTHGTRQARPIRNTDVIVLQGHDVSPCGSVLA
jgi:hypothetical protein